MPPALNLAPQQLFWVGYAQNHCLLLEQYDTVEGVIRACHGYIFLTIRVSKLFFTGWCSRPSSMVKTPLGLASDID